jgi:hypothetical protein
MAVQPTLTQFFGTNATETSTDLVIKKADLVSTAVPVAFNFTPTSTTDTAEKNALALLHRWRLNQDSSVDSQFKVSEWQPSLIQINSKWYTRYRATIDITVEQPTTQPNPNDI